MWKLIKSDLAGEKIQDYIESTTFNRDRLEVIQSKSDRYDIYLDVNDEYLVKHQQQTAKQFGATLAMINNIIHSSNSSSPVIDTTVEHQGQTSQTLRSIILLRERINDYSKAIADLELDIKRSEDESKELTANYLANLPSQTAVSQVVIVSDRKYIVTATKDGLTISDYVEVEL